jgi:restriction system protein
VSEQPDAPQVDLAEILVDGARNAVDLLLPLWPLWLLVSAIGLGKVVVALYRYRRLSRSGIAQIDRMDGATFERYLASRFRRLGYAAEVVGSSRGDYGGDLVIRKNGTRTIVQAKRYGKSVGVPAVQQAAAAKSIYDCTDAMVVTNSRFTQQARKLAKANDVRLIDRDELVTLLLKTKDAREPTPKIEAPAIKREQTPAGVRDVAATGEPESICARCGEPVSEKVRSYCLAHRDRFSGLIYCYQHQRGFKHRSRGAA